EHEDDRAAPEPRGTHAATPRRCGRGCHASSATSTRRSMAPAAASSWSSGMRATRFWRCAIVLVFALGVAVPVAAQDKVEELDVEMFYPLTTRRPVVERELEFTANHAKGADGRLTEVSAGLEFRPLPRWQVELTVPFIVRDPRGGPFQ